MNQDVDDEAEQRARAWLSEWAPAYSELLGPLAELIDEGFAERDQLRSHVEALRVVVDDTSSHRDQVLARLRAVDTERDQLRAERDEWKKLAAELRVQESLVSGALCDAGDVDVFDFEAGIRELTAQRDQLRAAMGVLRGAAHEAMTAADRMWGIANGALRTAHPSGDQTK